MEAAQRSHVPTWTSRAFAVRRGWTLSLMCAMATFLKIPSSVLASASFPLVQYLHNLSSWDWFL